ncbi:MAG: methylmalonyl Co-A mutase-associated GTPase MeaB [Sporocytophaga sp.]|uniref:methylmalonyl Co-A mutase-associated GTPase MeaB n=1 Tax=Sporocytophaga sp. TaxID=2231183 RepID=UPI001B192055|nr:methylmalonyl Co-A mutase-associated GTPase MeaB [Sporocytophaga sp.]MBO9700206.1 methylmalonyl Co-A mutase-associated GTPase MeaB [Sporocytophaga sp.]
MSQRKNRLDLKSYYDGILNGDRLILSKAITLIESSLPEDQDVADLLIRKILPHSGNSLRLGITGVPGAGKSAFIESFGSMLVNTGMKIAVLPIDPSSRYSKGSILGDKTRMEKLSSHPNAFIRPSASGGMLGGVASRTQEAILLCEAAGFNLIFIETVGVGQSEVKISELTDLVLLLLVSGTGDELQTLKKGIMEVADIFIVSKTDGENMERALEYANAIKQSLSYFSKDSVKVFNCSSETQYGLAELWSYIKDAENISRNNGSLNQKRRQQNYFWLVGIIDQMLHNEFYKNEEVQKNFLTMKDSVMMGEVPAQEAAKQLFNIFKGKGL